MGEPGDALPRSLRSYRYRSGLTAGFARWPPGSAAPIALLRGSLQRIGRRIKIRSSALAVVAMSAIQIALVLLLCVITYPFVIVFDRLGKAFHVKKVYAVPVTEAQLHRERINSYFTTPIHPVTLAIAMLSGLMRVAQETWLAVALTFALTFVWGEVYHYLLHRAIHLRSLHFIHREHHRSHITNVWTSISFSFYEEFFFALGMIGFLSLVSWWQPVSLYGIVAWYLLYFFTNTLGHSNFEINQPGYTDSFFGGIFTTSAYHAMHHARYVKNYGLLTRVMDRLFDSEWSDTSEVQSRAARGEPLTALRQRLDGQEGS
jgi:sterol desaturase/sphingolipid hydroxylase (fatty acid hydroxylase superfamily)